MELSSPKIKKFLIFPQKEAFFIFREKELFYISERNFPCSKNKKIHPEKISYISGNGTFWPQA